MEFNFQNAPGLGLGNPSALGGLGGPGGLGGAGGAGGGVSNLFLLFIFLEIQLIC